MAFVFIFHQQARFAYTVFCVLTKGHKILSLSTQVLAFAVFLGKCNVSRAFAVAGQRQSAGVL